MSIQLLTSAALAFASLSPCLLATEAALAEHSPNLPVYIDVQGLPCLKQAALGGKFTSGNPEASSTEGEPYISALLCATADIAYFQKKKADAPIDVLDPPNIQGNTKEKARELAFKLARENKNNCVNDSLYAHGFRSTPLSQAIYCKDVELVQLLLEQGAKPNDEVQMKKTVLLGAIKDKAPKEIFELLIKHGINASPEANPGLQEWFDKCPAEMQDIKELLQAAQ